MAAAELAASPPRGSRGWQSSPCSIPMLCAVCTCTPTTTRTACPTGCPPPIAERGRGHHRPTGAELTVTGRRGWPRSARRRRSAELAPRRAAEAARASRTAVRRRPHPTADFSANLTSQPRTASSPRRPTAPWCWRPTTRTTTWPRPSPTRSPTGSGRRREAGRRAGGRHVPDGSVATCTTSSSRRSTAPSGCRRAPGADDGAGRAATGAAGSPRPAQHARRGSAQLDTGTGRRPAARGSTAPASSAGLAPSTRRGLAARRLPRLADGAAQVAREPAGRDGRRPGRRRRPRTSWTPGTRARTSCSPGCARGLTEAQLAVVPPSRRTAGPAGERNDQCRPRPASSTRRHGASGRRRPASRPPRRPCTDRQRLRRRVQVGRTAPTRWPAVPPRSPGAGRSHGPAHAAWARPAGLGARPALRVGRPRRGTGRLATGLHAGLGNVPDLAAARAGGEDIGNPVAVTGRRRRGGQLRRRPGAVLPGAGGWIGGYVLFLLVRPLSKRAMATNQTPLRVALGGWLTPALWARSRRSLLSSRRRARRSTSRRPPGGHVGPAP